MRKIKRDKSRLMKFLYDRSDSVSIDEAIAEARKRWPKSTDRN